MNILLVVLSIIALILFLKYRANFCRYRFGIREITDELIEVRNGLESFNIDVGKEVKEVRKERRARVRAWKEEVEQALSLTKWKG